MTDHYDVVIVGSGPAGSTAAYELAQGGLKVLALDKEKFPRYKPCGGALSSRIQSILPFNFTGVVENTISGILFTHTFKQDIPVKSDKPLAYLVKRERFDNLLVEKAKERGATVRVGERVKSFLCRGNTIDVITNRGTYTTKFLIGADGPFSVVKRMFMPDGAQTLGLAMEGELEATGASLTGMNDMAHVDFGYIQNGYGWIFPKNGLFSVGVATLKGQQADVKQYYHGFLSGKNIDHLRTIRVQGWTIPVYTESNGKPLQKNVLLLGDAGNMVDPFIGEGIYYAIKGAQTASRAILGEGLHDSTIICREIDKEMSPDLKAADKVAKFIYNFPDLCYAVLTFYPELMVDYFSVLQGENTYYTFYATLKKNIHKVLKVLAKKKLGEISNRVKRYFQ